MNPSFASSLAAELRGFLAFKRALGLAYVRQEAILRSFDRFLVEHGPRGRQPLGAVMLSWLGRDCAPRKRVTVAGDITLMRQLHSWLRRQGRATREPSWPRLRARSRHVPHILTKGEVLRLLQLCAKLGYPRSRRVLYRVLLLVLYCTGLRLGEAVRLRVRDVDFGRATFFILASKGRERWVPYHRSLSPELRRYLAARPAIGRGALAPDDRFFVGASGSSLRVERASLTVRQLLRTAGIKPAAGRLGPRPYDMRHAFAVHRLTRWYRARVDLHSRLPWLSAYMGHVNLLGTETYLTTTPELLALVGARFRRRFLVDRPRV